MKKNAGNTGKLSFFFCSPEQIIRNSDANTDSKNCGAKELERRKGWYKLAHDNNELSQKSDTNASPREKDCRRETKGGTKPKTGKLNCGY